MAGPYRLLRRRRLRREPFPAEWLSYVEGNFPLYHHLSEADRRELLADILVLLDEKHFEGAGGLEMTDEIRVTIAAQAALLLLHRKHDFYPGLVSIVVYPSSYVAPASERLPGGVVVEGRSARLGESRALGAVVLSWDDVRRGAADIHDGHNVVFHEFAHQLDRESGAAEGLPVLPRRSSYLAWARVLGQAYEELRRDVAAGRPTVMRSYGAENPAEFFAVATECFFEKPVELGRHHPELFAELAEFYRQDPREFFPTPEGGGPEAGGSEGGEPEAGERG